MTQFLLQDYAALANRTSADLPSNPDLQAVVKKLQTFHEDLYSQLRLQNLKLYPKTGAEIVTFQSVSTPNPTGAIALQYFRSATQATIVERLMGREEVAAARHIEARRHPVIELRLTEHHLAIELILSPEAWWDQRNLIGKLSIARHKLAFYDALRALGKPFKLGFWRGVHLSDMHIQGNVFFATQVMNEWMSTFESGKDWFRVGIWYDKDDERIADPALLREDVLRHIRQLYAVYEHIVWTSDNNYQDFYQNSPLS